MAKYSERGYGMGRPISDVRTTSTTFEGALGVVYDYKTELWNMTTCSMVGKEPSFYESAQSRDNRLRTLVEKITEQPGGFEWLSRFVPYLRNQMNMRTAAVVVSAVAVETRRQLVEQRRAPKLEVGYSLRRMTAAPIERPDEFGEWIGFYRQTYRRTIPISAMRGLADRFSEIIGQYNAMKYDGVGNAMRLGDVIKIIHPGAKSVEQGEVYRYLLGRRFDPANIDADFDRLPMIKARRELEAMPYAERESLSGRPLFSDVLKEAGMTWENLSGWLGRKLTAEDWENIIPSMGYMALLRNLRNFTQAGIRIGVVDQVCARLMDPAQVAKSRQLPFRFYSAYREIVQYTEAYSGALERAYGLSTEQVPSLHGGTMILVDTSASMGSPLSVRSSVQYVDIAALMATTLKSKGSDVDVVAFADSAYELKLDAPKNVFRSVDQIRREIGRVGYGTNVYAGVRFLDPQKHARLIVLSDMQDVGGFGGNENPYSGVHASRSVPADMRVYSFNLGGYETGYINPKNPNRFIMSGFSDAAWTLMHSVENRRDQEWPF